MSHIRQSHQAGQAAGDAAPGPGRLPGRPHSAASGGDRRPYEQVLPGVVTSLRPGDGLASRALVGAHPYHRRMPGSTTGRRPRWFTLRRADRASTRPNRPGRPGICAVCRGPARPGYARCYQCAPARPARPGPARRRRGAHLLRGEGHRVRRRPVALQVLAVAGPARRGPRCWPCCSPSCTTTAAACGGTRACPRPGRLAVVPTGCGRPGPHPLLELAAPYLRLPVTGLVIRPGEQGRDPNRTGL